MQKSRCKSRKWVVAAPGKVQAGNARMSITMGSVPASEVHDILSVLGDGSKGMSFSCCFI